MAPIMNIPITFEVRLLCFMVVVLSFVGMVVGLDFMFDNTDNALLGILGWIGYVACFFVMIIAVTLGLHTEKK